MSNDSVIETEIIECLLKESPMRTTQLIKKIQEKLRKGTGSSTQTLYRKIGYLKKKNLILEIGPDNYKAYDIKDSDNRAKYIILKDADERWQYLDELLDLLQTGDKADIISVFEELNRYTSRYPLKPAQLDKIVLILGNDMEIVYNVLSILHQHLTRQHLAPLDTNSLINRIKQILRKIGNSDSENLNVESYCLEILGMRNDPFVVDQLMKDAQNFEKMKKIKEYYKSPYLSRVIEKQRKKLFDFERSLRKENQDPNIMERNHAISEIISEIRSTAANNVIYPRFDSDLYSAVI